MWWIDITWWIGAIAIMGLVVGATGRRAGSSCIQFPITRSESGVVATGGLALVITGIRLFGGSGIIMAVEEILEVFQGLVIKVTVTTTNVVIDMFLRKGIEEQDLGFIIVKFLFITTIQELNHP